MSSDSSKNNRKSSDKSNKSTNSSSKESYTPDNSISFSDVPRRSHHLSLKIQSNVTPPNVVAGVEAGVVRHRTRERSPHSKIKDNPQGYRFSSGDLHRKITQRRRRKKRKRKTRPRRVEAPKSGTPKAESPNPEKVEAPKGGGPKLRALFPQPKMSLVFSSSGRLLVDFR